MDKTDPKVVIKHFGTAAALARLLKSHGDRKHITTTAVAKWKRIPPGRCREIQLLSGGVFTAEEMRPDFFCIAAAPQADAQ